MRLTFLFLLSACSNPLTVIGDDTADSVLLTDAGPLAHLGSAMGVDDATASDLFDSDLTFGDAPDPSAWLASEHTAHAQLADGTGQSLSVLTFNTGLLNRTYLLSRVQVPFTDERAAVMGEEVFSAGHDIVFLQEVWEVEDAERLQAAAESEGYTVARPDTNKLQRETGLVMAVRSELIGDTPTVDVIQYDAQCGSENFPGPNLKRGYLHWRFMLADTEAQVDLYNTHLTPFYDKWQTRNLQVRQLGLDIASQSDDALVLVGGDFNAGWYYADDTWTDAEGEVYPGWWRNPTMPALLSHYAGVTDLANLAEAIPEVERGNAVSLDTDSTWLDEPFGDETVCDGANHFTATDCNSLYWTSYAATEFPARMDLLFVRDGTGQLRARSRSLAFVEPVDVGTDSPVELSDHFGQQVTLEIID
jgi:hypothetical protein